MYNTSFFLGLIHHFENACLSWDLQTTNTFFFFLTIIHEFFSKYLKAAPVSSIALTKFIIKPSFMWNGGSKFLLHSKMVDIIQSFPKDVQSVTAKKSIFLYVVKIVFLTTPLTKRVVFCIA